VFERDPSGKIYFPARWFRAMLRETSNIVNQSQIVAQNWIKYKDVKVEKSKTSILNLKTQPPVAGRKQGREMNCECLPPGLTLETQLLVPENLTGIIEKWVRYAGEWEGIGSYRRGYGNFEVAGFKDEGKVA
jgi:hypothetical protein